MDKTFSIKYGTEHCAEVLGIVLESPLNAVQITTDDAEEIATIVPDTHMAFLQNGKSKQLQTGDALWVVYNPIMVMAQLRAAANFTHLLYHMSKLGANKDG